MSNRIATAQTLYTADCARPGTPLAELPEWVRNGLALIRDTGPVLRIENIGADDAMDYPTMAAC